MFMSSCYKHAGYWENTRKSLKLTSLLTRDFRLFASALPASQVFITENINMESDF
jgi:hypothetical protein